MNYTIALAGNPNSGKTTLFNALTGEDQYVGNWPGVTVERKEARFAIGEDQATLVDLPGVYSLSPYSIEEKITRHFLAQHRPDVVLNIVDATNLERNLYLTMQLLEMERPTVVALNLMDEVTAGGGRIDCARLSALMRMPVVSISAKKQTGFDELFAAIAQQAHEQRTPRPVAYYDEATRAAVARVVAALGGADAHALFDEPEHLTHRDAHGRDDDHAPTDRHAHIGGYADAGDIDFAPPADWLALKLLEGDEDILASAKFSASQRPAIEKAVEDYVATGAVRYPGIDGLTLIVKARYDAIERLLAEIAFRRPRQDGETKSQAIDRVVLHRVFAFPIFFLVMAAMFLVTFGPVGTFCSNLVETGICALSDGLALALTALGAPAWFQSLVLDGAVAGVGGVLVFMPQILLIFLFLSIFEDSGYMARAAFITDRLLRRLGLSGRSFIPMLMGFGCTTTAVIGARAVENERDRRMTIMLTPFMSCGAKLPVYALFTAALFPQNGALVVLSLYLLGMLVMAASGLVLRKTVFRTGETPFVMELPPYRVPTVRNVLKRLGTRSKDFLTRAGTLIFAMSVVIWFLRSFSPNFTFVADSQQSLFGAIGGFLAPLFAPLGFGDWQRSAALLSGLVAKEAVVSTLQVIYQAPDATALTTLLSGHFTQLSAYAFLVFVLLYVPCVSATAAIAREMRSWRHTLLALALQLGTAYTLALLIYQTGRLFGFV